MGFVFLEQEENHKKAYAGRGQESKWEIPIQMDASL